MTREEAIEIIKERISKQSWCTSDEDMEALYKAIPELTESEDERIRKKILDIVRTAPFDEEKDILEDWLEKQKEHKPDIELIQRSWYMEGYHDGEFNMEPKWTVKAKKGGPRYEENPRYGQSLTEEQKPANDRAFEEWIDDWWKHNKVNNPDSYNKGDEIQFDERGFKNFCRGIRNMYAEQKQWSEGDEAIIEGACNALEIHGHTKLASMLKSLRPSWKSAEIWVVIAETLDTDNQYHTEVYLENSGQKAGEFASSLVADMCDTMGVTDVDPTSTWEIGGDGWFYRVRIEENEIS